MASVQVAQRWVDSLTDNSDDGGREDTAAVARLEYFLDAVLKQELHGAMSSRDRFIDLVAQCTQLQGLLMEMTALAKPAAGGAARSQNKILVNLGNHFYTSASVVDNRTIWLNIGCGVVIERTREEAVSHLKKRESIARAGLHAQNVEILRLKFRIRLVTEAIRRLHQQCIGLAA